MHLNTRWNYLLNPVFMTGLFVLLCNDLFLKEAWGNALTGKLSDVAGVCILPLFIAFLLPGRKRTALGFTALFFIFWKTELSTPFLNVWNAHIPFGLNRVADLTDLLVLPVLLLSASVLDKPERFSFTYMHKLPAVRLGVLFLAVFAFGATSHVKGGLLPYGQGRSISIGKQYTVPYSIDSSLAILKRFPAPVEVCSDHTYAAGERRAERSVWLSIYEISKENKDTVGYLNVLLSQEERRKKSRVYIRSAELNPQMSDSVLFGHSIRIEKKYRKFVKELMIEDILPK
ncbi:MAG: hypothetical protein IBJ09_06040 [Bacteroidia bacterium]|nr:hypothetical protein [Bacteroidia bacterium]